MRTRGVYKTITNHIRLRQKIKLKKEVAKRDYKAEYKKFQSSDKAKKYRAELNQYNRKKGTYGNGDGKDASHKGGKIMGFEKESTNRGRAEKSRLKKETANEGSFKTTLRPQKKDINKMKVRFKHDPRRVYTLKSVETGRVGGTSYMFAAPGNRKEHFTPKTWDLANKKGWLSLESVNEGGMGILDKDQTDVLHGIVMKNKNKNSKAILSIVMKDRMFSGVDKKELLGYIEGAKQFVKYMKSESVNEAVKFDSIQPKDTIDYGYAQYYVAKNDGKNIHMGLVAKKKATGGMFTSDAKLSKSNFDSQIRVKFIKRVLRNGKPLKESVNEAKIAHSKGGYVEVGKWYLLNYGKWKDTVKVVSIDAKGMKVYNPNDNWRYTIPMTMIKKKKIGGYMTPIDESVNGATKSRLKKETVSRNTLRKIIREELQSVNEGVYEKDILDYLKKNTKMIKNIQQTQIYTPHHSVWVQIVEGQILKN
mgnify:CR=1 FL=1